MKTEDTATSGAIERVRLSSRSDIRDEEIAWGIQLYRSRDQLEWCLRHIRRNYPISRIVLINDGDGLDYSDLATRFECAYTPGQHLMRLETSHLYVKRLLEQFVTGREVYFFRIDPDTRVWRRFRQLPSFSSLFGTLETITEGYQDEVGVPANVQGGCMGMTRDVAESVLASGLLNADVCETNCLSTWARCRDMRLIARRGRFCDDFVMSWLVHQLGIPIVESAEIRSRWRMQVANSDERYAVTHPHKNDWTWEKDDSISSIDA